MVELGAMSWSNQQDKSFVSQPPLIDSGVASPTDLLGDEITRIRILAVIPLPLFEDNLEQAWMSGFVSGSQLGRGFLVRGISVGRRRAGGVGFECDGHRKQRLNRCL
jgi:hypothetical protein